MHSRIGLLDVFVMFWALAAFGCLLIDRDQARDRTLAGGRRSVRWWRVAAGLCLGLCISTKWSGLFFAAMFGIASVLWDVAARRRAGGRHWLLTGLLRDGGGALALMLPVAAAVYLASWTGWLQGSTGYNRQWAAQHPADTFVPDALRALWDYHRQMWHANTTLRAFHPYRSHPWSWMVLGRPTSFDYRGSADGLTDCPSRECAQAISDLGNPVIWWGGTIAVVVLVVVWLLGRDWRAGAILAGLAGGYLPWFAFSERTIYSFYAVAFGPYVVLALTFCLGLILGPARATPDRRLTGAAVAGSVVLLAVLTFAFFYPVLSDQVVDHAQWSDRMWLRSWWWPEPNPSSTPASSPSPSPPLSPSISPSLRPSLSPLLSPSVGP